MATWLSNRIIQVSSRVIMCGYVADWYGATASNSVSLRFTSWARRRHDRGVSRFSSIPPRKLGHFLSSSLFTGVIKHSVPCIWETESVIYIKHNDFFLRRMSAFNVEHLIPVVPSVRANRA